MKSTDGRHFAGTLPSPIEAFRVLVTFTDQSAVPAQRIWPALFHGEAVEIVAPAGGTVTAGTDLAVTFTVLNQGPGVGPTLVASDDGGNLVTVGPPVLDVGLGAEASADGPTDGPGRRAALEQGQRPAHRDATGAVGGFNSASATFKVRDQEAVKNGASMLAA